MTQVVGYCILHELLFLGYGRIIKKNLLDIFDYGAIL
jgi:hypothetical protein